MHATRLHLMIQKRNEKFQISCDCQCARRSERDTRPRNINAELNARQWVNGTKRFTLFPICAAPTLRRASRAAEQNNHAVGAANGQSSAIRKRLDYVTLSIPYAQLPIRSPNPRHVASCLHQFERFASVQTLLERNHFHFLAIIVSVHSSENSLSIHVKVGIFRWQKSKIRIRPKVTLAAKSIIIH